MEIGQESAERLTSVNFQPPDLEGFQRLLTNHKDAGDGSTYYELQNQWYCFVLLRVRLSS